MYEFSVLIHAAPDVPGQWVSHCLQWGLVSQGNSPSHAAEMIQEAIVICIEDGNNQDRRPSPDDIWAICQTALDIQHLAS